MLLHMKDFIMIEAAIHQEVTTIINKYTHVCVCIYICMYLPTELQNTCDRIDRIEGRNSNSTITAGDFNTLLSIMIEQLGRRSTGNWRCEQYYKPTRLNRHGQNTPPNHSRTDAQSSQVHATFSRTDHILDIKMRLNALKRIKAHKNVLWAHWARI